MVDSNEPVPGPMALALYGRMTPALTVQSRHFFDRPESTRIYWDILADLMRDRDTQGYDVPGFRRGIVAFQERASLSLNPITALFRKDNQASRRKPAFTPTVAMLAGITSTITGTWPDATQITLYRDGNDWVGPHTDYEGILGPTPEDVVISTWSFGATRALGLWPMGVSQKDIASTPPAEVIEQHDGGLFVMRGTVQRDWVHSLLPCPDCALPRISVIFMSYQQHPKLAMSMLFEHRDDLPFPRFIGSDADCTERWLEIVSAEGLHESQAPPGYRDRATAGAPNLAIIHQDLSVVSSIDEAVHLYLGRTWDCQG